MKRDRISKLVVLVLIVAASIAKEPRAYAADKSVPPAGLRLFFTGHSFHMFVPRMMHEVATAAGIEGHTLVGVQGIGGSRVIQHWDKPDAENKAKAALKSGRVDVFTMAAHVQIPDEGITNFVALGLEHNPAMKFYVQASWYPYDVPDPQKRIRDLSQRDTMTVAELQAAVDEWRTKLEAQADDLNRRHGKQCVFIVPVGDAVVKLRGLVIAGKFPGVAKQSDLFRDQIGHGLDHIHALATYCNFAAIYKTNPTGLKPAFPVGDLAPEQDKILQEIAWEVVSKSKHAGVDQPSQD